MPIQPLENANGRKWSVDVLGKRALNGAMYCNLFYGELQEDPENKPFETVYDIARKLIDHVEANNAEMEHPTAIIIRIKPPSKSEEG